jgi:hypothetical protein
LRHRPRHPDLAADQQRDRVRWRVTEYRHRRLDLAETVGDRAGGVGGDEQWIVELVRHVRLVARRAPDPHLGHRHLHLDRGQQRHDPRQLGGCGAADQPYDVRPWHIDVHSHPREGDVLERHRLLRHLEIDAVARNELVDDVEVLHRLAVEFHHGPVAHHQRRGRVVRAAHRDEAELRISDGKAVQIHRFRVENPHPP